MPRAKTPRTPRPKVEKVVKKSARQPEPAANGNGNGYHSSVDLEYEIRLRAYELYASRGYGEGRADQDWIQAEQEVLSRHA